MEWEIIFYFTFFEDSIVYKRRLETNEKFTYNDANNYAKKWLEKFEYRYGTCTSYTIRNFYKITKGGE